MKPNDHDTLETVKHRLASGYTEHTAEALKKLAVAQLLPPLTALGLTDFAITVAGRGTEPITVQFGDTRWPLEVPFDLEALPNRHGVMKFRIEHDANSVAGYSGNCSDWVLFATETELIEHGERILDALWFQFFEYD